MSTWITAVVMIILTVTIYFGMIRLYRRFNSPFMVPILTSTISIILVLTIFGLSYQTYMVGGQWIDRLLGPAVVSLAYPLYKQRNVLKLYFIPIITGVLAGSFTGILSGVQFAVWLGVEETIVYSLLPKSVTTPVAMEITKVLGGTPSLAAVFVMVAGIGGVVLGPYLLRWFKIDSYIGRGIGLGSASHGIGTSKAFEYGENTAAVSSVAMTLSAIAASIFGPLFIWLFYT